jgi:hypothetical protein
MCRGDKFDQDRRACSCCDEAVRWTLPDEPVLRSLAATAQHPSGVRSPLDRARRDVGTLAGNRSRRPGVLDSNPLARGIAVFGLTTPIGDPILAIMIAVTVLAAPERPCGGATWGGGSSSS